MFGWSTIDETDNVCPLRVSYLYIWLLCCSLCRRCRHALCPNFFSTHFALLIVLCLNCLKVLSRIPEILNIQIDDELNSVLIK